MARRTFAGIPEDYSTFDRAAIHLQGISYDGTSTWGKGADLGFEAFLVAAEHLELYDIETGSEVFRRGIYLAEPMEHFRSPVDMYQATLVRARQLLQLDKFLTFFGGEHSISIGILEAFSEKYPGLSVLQIDAHADLRPEYEGSPFNHACALHAASKRCQLVQVAIRSMDKSELAHFNAETSVTMHDIRHEENWMARALRHLSDDVYITFDLDALDPSLMPATGTPEPGGLFWYETLAFLKMVFASKRVVGFDIVELAPAPNLRSPQFLAAKLYYKMLTYKYEL